MDAVRNQDFKRWRLVYASAYASGKDKKAKEYKTMIGGLKFLVNEPFVIKLPLHVSLKNDLRIFGKKVRICLQVALSLFIMN